MIKPDKGFLDYNQRKRRKIMCNQFHIPNLATIQKYLKSDLDLPLATPDFKSVSEKICQKGIATVLLFKDDK